MSNSIGKIFTVTSFGESHGDCVGVILDGCPAGLPLTAAEIQKAVDKRKPIVSAGGTPRRESDAIQILSGLFKGKTTGAPLCLIVRNRNTDSAAYEQMRFTPRPGHADYTAYLKYGGYNDYRGGGRFSGRITVGFVMAGAVAAKLLLSKGIEVLAHTVQIGKTKATPCEISDIRRNSYDNDLRCADVTAAMRMMNEIERARKRGDSVGGMVEAVATGVPAGLGEPVFDTLEGDLAKAFFAIPAAKGVEFGAGFSVTSMKGSENNDPLIIRNRKITFLTNNSGGISGGISNGMPVIARIAFKPTPSIAGTQQTVDLKKGKKADLNIKGRHDACIVPRVVPVVESMMSIILCDFAIRAGLIQEIIKWD